MSQSILFKSYGFHVKTGRCLLLNANKKYQYSIAPISMNLKTNYMNNQYQPLVQSGSHNYMNNIGSNTNMKINRNLYTLACALQTSDVYQTDRLKSNRNNMLELNIKHASLITISRQFASFSSNKSPYDILNISKHATSKEIKVAYYKLAKEMHPDLHRNESQKIQDEYKMKFQELSQAYEFLNDPKKRAEFDRNYAYNAHHAKQQYAHGQYTHNAAHTGGKYSQAHAEEVFRNVMQDSTVIKEAISSVVWDLKEDLVFAYDSAKAGEWKHVKQVLDDNKIVIFGIVLPTVLLLRFPVLLPIAARVGITGGASVLRALIQTGQGDRAVAMLWDLIMQASKMQKIRSDLKAQKRHDMKNSSKEARDRCSTNNSSDNNHNNSHQGFSSDDQPNSRTQNTDQSAADEPAYRWRRNNSKISNNTSGNNSRTDSAGNTKPEAESAGDVKSEVDRKKGRWSSFRWKRKN